MNITQERYSLLRLWLESFKVVNRCAGKLVGIILISIVLFVLAAVIMGLLMGTTSVLAILQMGKTAQAAGLGALIAYLLFTLGSNVYGVVLCTVCWRLFANQALEQPQPLTETFSGSVLPAVYQIAAGFVLAIPMIVLGIICAILVRASSVLVALLLIALFFTVGIRLFYSFIAIAVANKGPIEGFAHSWKMTAGKNYMDTLLTFLMMMGSMVLIYLFFMAIAYGGAIIIPLYFADTFNTPYSFVIWALLALVFGLLALFAYFVIAAFPVLVFVNRNAVLFDAHEMTQDSTFVPLPELELPEIHPNPEHMQETQSTLRAPIVTEEKLTPLTADPQPKQPVPAAAQPVADPEPAAAPAEEPAHDTLALDGLEVSKSSINTSEKETDSLSEHLDKVYTPKKEDLVQYGEEDRMPTILFDDEMAKQLQENQSKFAANSKEEDKSNKKDDGPETIKMSKF